MSGSDGVHVVVARAFRDILSKECIPYSDIGTYEICISINDHENCYVAFNKTSVTFKNYSYFNYSNNSFTIFYNDPNLFDGLLNYIKASIAGVGCG